MGKEHLGKLFHQEYEDFLGGKEILQESPFIEANNFVGFSVLEVLPRKPQGEVQYIKTPLNPGALFADEYYFLQSVPLAEIISACGMRSWIDVFSLLPFPHIGKLTQQLSGRSLVTQQLPVLLEYQGVYINLSIGTRIAAAKLIGIQNIPALVLRTAARGVIVYTKEEYESVLERKNNGLWSGTLIKHEQEDISYATGTVHGFAGPWVFAKDINLAKAVYFGFGEK